MVDKLARSLWRVLAVIGATCGIVLVVATATNVGSRAFGSPLSGMLELSELALVGMVFLGLAYTEQQNGQVSTDIVTSRLSERTRDVINRVTGAIFAVLISVVAYTSWDRAFSSYELGEVQMGALAWPLWPGRFLIAIGFTTLTIALVLKVVRGPVSQDATDVSSRNI